MRSKIKDTPEAIDRSYLMKLQSDWGALIESFLTYVPERMKNLDRAFEMGDILSLEKTAHLLKSSCVALGAFNMAKVCGLLEYLSIQRATSMSISAVMDALRFEYLRANKELVALHPRAL